MKKCPYCAEEIQAEAIFCRFCDKRVEGVMMRRIIKIVIISAIAAGVSLLFIQKKEVIVDFINEAKSAQKFFLEILVDLKEGLASLKEHKTKLNI